MGYTHYWDNRTATANEWKQFVEGFRAIQQTLKAHHNISLAGPLGTGKVIITDSEVSFNGADGNDFETFRMTREGDGFQFCKTGYRPYDAAVVATLMLAKRIGFASWRSDGEQADHMDGLAILNGAFLNQGWIDYSAVGASKESSVSEPLTTILNPNFGTLCSLLATHVLVVTFTKTDGTVRVMRCTTKQDEIPTEAVTSTANRRGSHKVSNIRVWDLDKGDWRSFNFDTIKSVELES